MPIDPMAPDPSMLTVDYENAIAVTRAKLDEYALATTAKDELLKVLGDGDVPRLRSRFIVSEGSLSANCYGYEAVATPRLIVLKGGELAFEFAFFVSVVPSHAVWAFAVRSNGCVSFSPSTGYLTRFVEIDAGAPGLTEALMLQLLGGVHGYALVSQST